MQLRKYHVYLLVDRFTMSRTGSTSAGNINGGRGSGGGGLKSPFQTKVRRCSKRCVLIKVCVLLFISPWESCVELLNFAISIYALSSIVSDHSSSTEIKSRSVPSVVPPTREVGLDAVQLDSLPTEVKARILERLPYNQIVQLKSVSKSWKSILEDDDFLHAVSLREPSKLTACFSFIENGVLKLAGYDPECRSNLASNGSQEVAKPGKWRQFPPLDFLPSSCSPDADLFKQFLICSKDGLLCMNFSKRPHEARLVVFNPLTRQWKELPKLLHQRNPVLLHILTSAQDCTHSGTQSYRILAAGSSESSDEHVSKTTECYDSRTGQWERVGDLPGPAFALNEYQPGVYQNGNIFCIGFVEVGDHLAKGILRYNVQKRKWRNTVTETPLPSSSILQLVENCGELYLFSERESGRFTEHWVDKIEWIGDAEENLAFKMANVVRKRNLSGGRSMEVYPEFALVPCGDGKLCVYNTVDHSGEVRDVRGEEECAALPALPAKGFQGDLGFFCLNPISFAIEPRFDSKV